MDTNSQENAQLPASQTASDRAPFPFQLAATQSILAGNDTVVIAPVGAGKSYISRLLLNGPSAPSDAMVIVVTPSENFHVEQYAGYVYYVESRCELKVISLETTQYTWPRRARPHKP
jgi:ABC-type iron transport system FetAB ATPase subunit